MREKEVSSIRWVLAKTIFEQGTLIQKFAKDRSNEPELSKDFNEAWKWYKESGAKAQLKGIKELYPSTQLHPMKVYLGENVLDK